MTSSLGIPTNLGFPSVSGPNDILKVEQLLFFESIGHPRSFLMDAISCKNQDQTLKRQNLPLACFLAIDLEIFSKRWGFDYIIAIANPSTVGVKLLRHFWGILFSKHHIEPVVFSPIGSKTTASTPTSKDQWKHLRGIGIHHENVIDHSLPVHIWNSTPRANADWQTLEFGFLILERQKLCGRTDGSVRSVVDSCDCETDRARKIRGDSTHSSVSHWVSVSVWLPLCANGHPVWSNKRTCGSDTVCLSTPLDVCVFLYIHQNCHKKIEC